MKILLGARLANSPTAEEIPFVVATWEAVLPDISDADLREACIILARTAKFWPTPSEVLAVTPGVQAKQAQIATQKTDDGSQFPARILKMYASFGPKSSRAMKRLEGTSAGFVTGDDVDVQRAKMEMVRQLSQGDESVEVAILAGLDAYGWDAIQRKEQNQWEDKRFIDTFTAAYKRAMRDSLTPLALPENVRQIEDYRGGFRKIGA